MIDKNLSQKNIFIAHNISSGKKLQYICNENILPIKA